MSEQIDTTTFAETFKRAVKHIEAASPETANELRRQLRTEALPDAAFGCTPEASHSCFQRMAQMALVTLQVLDDWNGWDANMPASAPECGYWCDSHSVAVAALGTRIRKLLGTVSLGDPADISDWGLSPDDETMARYLFGARVDLEEKLEEEALRKAETNKCACSSQSGETTPTASTYAELSRPQSDTVQKASLEERVRRWAAEDSSRRAKGAASVQI